MRILFVCTGNICRSPTAEGIARHMAAKQGLQASFEFDSAGLSHYHVGEAPDARAIQAAAARNIDLKALHARVITPQDFENFDLILAMDKEHLLKLHQLCPLPLQHKIAMLTKFSEKFHSYEEVLDPYYGGKKGFEHVLDVCEDAVAGLIRYFNKN